MVYALAIIVVAVLAFATAMTVLYVMARDKTATAQREIVDLRLVNQTLAGANKGFIEAITEKNAEIARQEKAREAIRKKFDEANEALALCQEPKAMAAMLNRLFATEESSNDDEGDRAE